MRAGLGAGATGENANIIPPDLHGLSPDDARAEFVRSLNLLEGEALLTLCERPTDGAAHEALELVRAARSRIA